MKAKEISLVLAALLLLASVAPWTHAAPPTIYDLGTLGGTSSFGYAVSVSGQVAGSSDTTGGDEHAFLYTGTPGSGGAMADLGTLGGSASEGQAINASGEVVGYSYYTMGSADRRAFLYTGMPGSGGAMADLGTLGGSASEGQAINESGQVVGYSYTIGDSARHAFRYTGIPGSGGTMADLGSLGGNSFAQAINLSGQVAGSSYTAGGDEHAFLYTGIPESGGIMTDLGTLGGSQSFAQAINASGQVAGSSYTKIGEHAFLYTGTPGSGGAMADLGTLGGGSFAQAINASGQVAGSSYTTGGNEHAFLYTGTPGVDGVLIDLDAWLDVNNPSEGAKWTLTRALGLTDAGLITGYGTYDDGPGGLSDGTRAFLLDASALVPEPSSIVLAALGFVGLAVLGYRRRKRSGYYEHSGPGSILGLDRTRGFSIRHVKAILIIAATAILTVSAATPSFATQLFDSSGTTPFRDGYTGSDNYAGTVGLEFAVRDQAIEVTSLGYFDGPNSNGGTIGDGLQNTHQVGIWGPSQQLVASVSVGAGSILVGSFRYVTLETPVILPAGATYLLGGQVTTTDLSNSGDAFRNDTDVATISADAKSAIFYYGGLYTDAPDGNPTLSNGAFREPHEDGGAWFLVPTCSSTSSPSQLRVSCSA